MMRFSLKSRLAALVLLLPMMFAGAAALAQTPAAAPTPAPAASAPPSAAAQAPAQTTPAAAGQPG